MSKTIEALLEKEEEYGECEKCGGETFDKMVGDESFEYCGDCGWITH